MFDSTLGRGDFSKDLLTLFTLVNYQVVVVAAAVVVVVAAAAANLVHLGELPGGAREELEAGRTEADS